MKRLPLPLHFIAPEIFESARWGLGLSACDGCGFVFTNPRPPERLLADFYGGLNQPRRHAAVTTGSLPSRKTEVFVSYIERHVTGRSLFDYGCAEGGVLVEAQRRGWRVLGYDVDGAFAHCEALGLPVTDRLESVDRSFDAIFMNQVLEHLADPAAALASQRRLLATGGKLFVQCPNARSLRARLSLSSLVAHAGVDERYRAFPIHLSYFSPRTLARLIEQQGYRVIETRTFGLGLDEYFHADDVEANEGRGAEQRGLERSDAGAGAAGSATRFARARLAAKEAFLRSGLGEHVMVMAEAQ